MTQSSPVTEDDMSLDVALDFADHPRPYPSMQAPADTVDELREALRVLAAAYRAAAPQPSSAGTASAASPTQKQIQAAIDVMNDHGIDFRAPWECDLDDQERGRYEALCCAIQAAFDADGYSHPAQADANSGVNTTPSAAPVAPAVAQPSGVREALELAEDVLSRAPFSTGIWPNGMHPQVGIEKIRAALAMTSTERA